MSLHYKANIHPHFFDDKSSTSIPSPIRWFVLSSKSLKRSKTSRFNASIEMMDLVSTRALLISPFALERAMLLILFFK